MLKKRNIKVRVKKVRNKRNKRSRKSKRSSNQIRNKRIIKVGIDNHHHLLQAHHQVHHNLLAVRVLVKMTKQHHLHLTNNHNFTNNI